MPPTLTTPTGQVYYKGHVRHPQKDHLMAVSAAHHGARLQMLRRFAPPPVYDSRVLGIVGPVKDQGQCFPAGTMVTMADGSQKPIEKIIVQEAVLTAEGNQGRVLEVMRRDYEGELIGIGTGYVPKLFATPEHPILTSGGYKPVKSLTTDDELKHADSRGWERLFVWEKRPFKGSVYNLSVTGDHSYVAEGLGVHNCGSCHSADTEVLTAKGWVAWPDYDWLTPVGTMHPGTGRLEFQPPLVQHIYDHDGPMYYYDGRSTDFALTPNHRMVWRRNKGPWVKSAVADLPAYADIPHATTGWAGTELERLGVGDRIYQGDDLLALVALVISDGYVGHDYDGNGGQNQVTFCCFRDDRTNMVRALAYRLGIPEMPSRPGVWYFRDGDLAEWFRQNAYEKGGFTAAHKHIPDLVKCASQRQIAHFLQFFGDQCPLSHGGRRFSSCSRLMIDDLQELLLRVGKRGTVEEHPPRTRTAAGGRVFKGNHPEFTLTERKRDGLSVERENLRVDHYKGKVYCTTVENGTLVTRRNKRVLISSNCWDFSGTCVIEVAFYLAKLLKPDGSDSLSEEYTLSCGRNGGCNGDDNVSVLEWAKKTGLPKTSDYGPYSAQAGRCSWKQGMTLYKIDDYVFADPQAQGQSVASTPAIQAAIMQYGCVGCAVAAGGSSFWNSGQGVDTGTSRSIDHDVALVGWKTVGNKVIWIMRNSWNTKWGDKCANDANPNPTEAGYAWVQEGADQIGTEAVAAIVHNPNPSEPPDWLP